MNTAGAGKPSRRTPLYGKADPSVQCHQGLRSGHAWGF